MSDAAAFFASKKKKKKAFTFNANLVDASTVTSTVHVEAPALSNATVDGESLPLSSSEGRGGTHSAVTGDGGDPSGGEWDDAALAADTTAASTSTRTAALAVGSLSIADSGGHYHHHNPYIDPDNIAEKLRVEETKAALAAAREGMEREAQKVALEKERKQQEAAEQQQHHHPPGAGSLGGGKWLPPHMRGSAGVSLRARMMGGSQKLDVADEELFPDLASADKMLAEKEAAEKKRALAASKPITALSGSTWASKMAAKKTEREAATAGVGAKKIEEVTTPAPEPVPPEPVEEAAPEAAPVVPENEAAPDPESSQPAAAKKLVKKKKKDLSTFKTGATS